MRGNLLSVWDETWNLIWRHIQVDHEDSPFYASEALQHQQLPDEFEAIDDLFSALYVEAYKAFTPVLRGESNNSIEQDGKYALIGAIDIGAISNDFSLADAEFKAIEASFFNSESKLVKFCENAYDVIEEFDTRLADRYRTLLKLFVEKFSLRYEIREPCELCPTLPGIFASLFGEIKTSCRPNPHLDELMSDFEEALMDLKTRPSGSKIRTCMVKQINLLEAIAAQHPDTSRNTIGAICGDLKSWPHDSLCESMKSLYKFTCDYPGIRHGGTADSRRRAIDLRDLLSVSIMLIGFAPYLSNEIDAKLVYEG